MTSLMALIASDFTRLHRDRCDDQGGFTVQVEIIWCFTVVADLMQYSSSSNLGGVGILPANGLTYLAARRYNFI